MLRGWIEYLNDNAADLSFQSLGPEVTARIKAERVCNEISVHLGEAKVRARRSLSIGSSSIPRKGV